MRILADLLLLLFFVGILFSPVALGYLCVNPSLGQYNTDSPSGTSVQFGGQDVTFTIVGGGTAVFTVEAGQITFDSDWVVANNAAGNPSKQKGQQKIPEGELTLQYIGASALKAPAIFSTFSLIVADAGTYTFIVSRIVHAFSNDGSANKCTIGCRYKLN